MQNIGKSAEDDSWIIENQIISFLNFRYPVMKLWCICYHDQACALPGHVTSNVQASYLWYLQIKNGHPTSLQYCIGRQKVVSGWSWEISWPNQPGKIQKMGGMESLIWRMTSKLGIRHYEYFPEVSCIYNSVLRPPISIYVVHLKS